MTCMHRIGPEPTEANDVRPGELNRATGLLAPSCWISAAMLTARSADSARERDGALLLAIGIRIQFTPWFSARDCRNRSMIAFASSRSLGITGFMACSADFAA